MSVPAVLPQRRILGLIFLTVFMDIVGFSIIIPLFPHLLDYYITQESSSGVLVGTLSSAADWLSRGTEFDKHLLLPVLFGGILSSLYSGLQFVFSPIWGALSDRFGRRRILTITLAGNVISYFLWIFAGQFWVVVVTRLISGMMAGNIAVASAAAADITDEKERTKGMAVVGIAIGMGFVFGPVIGGFAAPDHVVKATADSSFGLNPFSIPAAIAASLALLNFLLVVKFFPETLAPERRASADAKRPSVFDLATVRSSAVRRTSFANFVYQVAFTGMENTIVFLTFALFLYNPRDNAWLFLFNGACMIFAQGLARQLVKRLGQRKVIMLGMLVASVAFVWVALIPTPKDGLPSPAWAEPSFYAGLGLISFATGLILPSVSALVSLYSDASEQGRNLGILRSAGSLARVIGPVTAALLYFHFGSHFWVYLGGAVLMLPAIWIVRGLPDPSSEGTSA
jgi:MFS family permease